MRWSSKSNPAHVEAIIASFSAPAEQVLSRLSAYNSEDWKKMEFWLNVSGLALYFLDHLQSSNISTDLDSDIRQKLESNLADNRVRTALMFKEFVVLNRLFQGAGIRYANLKGFTLQPASCPDLSLRHQSDFDFLIHPADLDRGRSLLEQRGYGLTGATPRTLEFKNGNTQKISFDEHYKLKSLSVELHIALDGLGVNKELGCDERLNRVRQWKSEAGTFPALCPADQWISQALHLLGHLRSEHTRPSWFLEFRNHAVARQCDQNFWEEVKALTHGDSYTTIALGLSILLAEELFGAFSSTQLRSWTIDLLPRDARIWAMKYGRRAILTDVPGTKLYMLLEDAIRDSVPVTGQMERVRRLIPLRLPPRILQPPAQDTMWLRIRRELIQFRFIAYRLRFHITQDALYVIELQRWKKLLRKDGREDYLHSHENMVVSSLHEPQEIQAMSPDTR